MRLAAVVGARPNFMKMAPLLHAMEQYPHVYVDLIHTGQHYDENLSDVFFRHLGIREPDIRLEVGSGSHGAQTGRILERVEEILQRGQYDRLIVVGDVNSTMAAALAAVKLGIPIAHVEAGLRSFDRSMPEEINRIVTDAVADMLFVTEPSGVENLLHEGHLQEQVHLVGNVMIDTLLRLLPTAQESGILSNRGLAPCGYGVITMHRPANVDSPESLGSLLSVMKDIANELPLVFPIHPRTRKRIEQFGMFDWLRGGRLIITEPLGYLDFLALTSQAKVIVTDSGGLQEESTALNIPCLTLRPNTERPITVEEGTSTLVGCDAESLRRQLKSVINGTYKQGRCPALWDGHAAERISQIIIGKA